MSLKGIKYSDIPEGKVAITWFNDYSGIIGKISNSTVVFNPVEVGLADIPHADLIIITHEHYDHFDAELVRGLQKQTNATVVTTPFVARQLKAISQNNLIALKVGETATIGKIKLNAERSDHPGSQPLTFIVTFPAMHKTYGMLNVTEKIDGEIIKL